jgi:hypothetical protein
VYDALREILKSKPAGTGALRMSDGVDIDRFVKDPSLLVELCREVIDELDSNTDDSDVSERERNCGRSRRPSSAWRSWA